MTRHPVVPTRKDVEAWRAQAEAVNRFGGVKLGQFDWSWVVLSLAAAWEKTNGQAAEIIEPEITGSLVMPSDEGPALSVYPLQDGRLALSMPNGTTANLSVRAARRIHRFIGSWLEVREDVENRG